MGKGTIISGGTDGQYQVQINYNRTAYNAEIAKLTQQITDWGTKISDKADEILSLEAEYASMLLAGYTADVLAAKKTEIVTAQTDKSMLELYKLSFEKRQQYLEDNMPDDETVTAWCADLTEDLSGTVGTVEIPGESTHIQIQPGYNGNAVYDQDRDGQLLPTVAATTAQAFYNLAMMPGWQKWKPTFRYATITAIDGDTASVTLENITSSQQGLDINQTSMLTGVSIEYMDCDGGAFSVGDEALIKFTGRAWSTPVIVGFKENPVQCCIFSEPFTTGAHIYTWTKTDDFSAADIGSSTWITAPTWTKQVISSTDKIILNFFYGGGVVYDAGTGKYSTQAPVCWGRYTPDMDSVDVADSAYLIIDINIRSLSQTPHTWTDINGSAVNRANLDVMLIVEALYEGDWYMRYAALRFNTDDVGKDGIYAGDILEHLNSEYPWAEAWRVAENGVYFDADFKLMHYPDVTGSDTQTPAIVAQILIDVREIKICGMVPDGATIGDIINPQDSRAVSFLGEK